jgi:sodium/pantothenate symporter
MARDEHTVLRAACGASVAIMCFYPVLMLCGAAINLSNPTVEPVERAMLWAAVNLLPPVAGMLLLAGILAAGLSSATTFLSLVGFSASHDILRRSQLRESARLRVSRLTMLAVGLIVLALAFAFPPRILWITYFAGTVFASSWGPVALMSVWSRRITAEAAFWGIVSGFVGNVAPKAADMLGLIDLPAWADPILIGAAVSTGIILLVSRRGCVSAAEASFQEALHRVPAGEVDFMRRRRTGQWALGMMASGFVLSALMCVFWALPYAAALQRPTSMLSGEAVLALCWGLPLVVSGLVLRGYLRRTDSAFRADLEPARTEAD